MTKHLWEVPHSYYCETGNFFKYGMNTVYSSWEEFAQPMKTMLDGNLLYEYDNDLNFLYRWDWRKADPDDYLFSYDENILKDFSEEEIEKSKRQFKEDSQTDTLSLFFIAQRKSYNLSAEVTVVEDDEPLVREWLNKKWTYMKDLWAPISE